MDLSLEGTLHTYTVVLKIVTIWSLSWKWEKKNLQKEKEIEKIAMRQLMTQLLTINEKKYLLQFRNFKDVVQTFLFEKPRKVQNYVDKIWKKLWTQ